MQGASVNRTILQHCFFWFGNTGADAAIAILLPTLKHFSCNGAVDWSTKCFCCESVLQNGDSFVIAQREFRREFGIHRNRAVPSGHAIRTLVRNFEATGSALKKKGGCVKTIHTSENIAVVRETIERIHTVLRVAALCHSCCLKGGSTDYTLPPFFFSVEPAASKFQTKVLMAWLDGTARLRWIPKSLRNSR